MTKRAILLEALASTPPDVVRLVRGLDETAAVQQTDGGWSCYDVVAHLAHSEPLYLTRLQRILAENEPVLADPHPNGVVRDPDRPIAAVADCFWNVRRVTLDWLREIIAADWQRPAIHETHGRTTLRFLVQNLVAHDIEHTSQLALILGHLRAKQRADDKALSRRREDASVPEVGP